MPPSAVVSFDVGGTLVAPHGRTFTACAMAAAREQRMPVSAARDLVLSSCLDDQACDQLERLCGLDLIRSIQHRRPVPMTALPGAVSMVGAVAEMARVVSLSNVSSVDAGRLPDGLDALVARSYLSCDIGAAKPSPRAFVAVAEGEGVHVADLVHVGDSWQTDVVGALGAEARCVWLDASRPRATVLVPGRLVACASPGDVPEAVRYLLKREGVEHPFRTEDQLDRRSSSVGLPDDDDGGA